MLQQEQVTPEEVTLEVYGAAPPMQVEERTELDGAVDRAISRALAPLANFPEEQEVQRVAMLQMALPIAHAYLELGSSPEHAAREAIAQLQIARNAVHERAKVVERKTGFFRWNGSKQSTVLALGVFGTAAAIAETSFAYSLASGVGIGGLGMERAEALGFPLIAGLAVGLLAKRRAGMGTRNAVAALAAAYFFLPAVLFSLDMLQIFPPLLASDPVHWVESHLFVGIVGVVFWPPLGILGTKLGEKFRARMLKR